jgi:hypothetical protein
MLTMYRIDTNNLNDYMLSLALFSVFPQEL